MERDPKKMYRGTKEDWSGASTIFRNVKAKKRKPKKKISNRNKDKECEACGCSPCDCEWGS